MSLSVHHWLISLSLMMSSCVHFAGEIPFSLGLRAYLSRVVVIHSSVEECWDWFFSYTLTSAVINLRVQVLQQTDFITCRCIPSSESTGSYDHFVLGFLRKLSAVFHNGCLISSPTNSMREFPFRHILSRAFFPVFLMPAILTRRRWCLSRVLAYISLMISEINVNCILLSFGRLN